MATDHRASRPSIWVEERTAVHTLGVYEDLVIVVPRAGSQDDPRHIELAGRLVEAVHARLGAPVRLLAVLPDAHRTGAPSSVVRGAVAAQIPRLDARLARAAIVLGGGGFGTALHRTVVSGFMMALRLAGRITVHGEVPPALEFLLGADAARRDRVARFCAEELLPGPAPGA